MRENTQYTINNAKSFEMFMIELKALVKELDIDLNISPIVKKVYEIFEPKKKHTITIVRNGVFPDLVNEVDDDIYDKVMEALVNIYGVENVRGSKWN